MSANLKKYFIFYNFLNKPESKLVLDFVYFMNYCV